MRSFEGIGNDEFRKSRNLAISQSRNLALFGVMLLPALWSDFAAAGTAALSTSSRTDRFESTDLPHPVGAVHMVPLGGTRAGEIVALGWPAFGGASLWLWLPSSAYGLPTGWNYLSAEAFDSLTFATGVVFSPDLSVLAHGGFTPHLPEFEGVELCVVSSGVGGFGAHPPVSDWCREFVCSSDPTCCGNEWDGACASLALFGCAQFPGTGCPWIGQPYPYLWTFGSYCGEANGMSFPDSCFNECCFRHDVCYGSCGAHEGDLLDPDPKVSCDKAFKSCMHHKCVVGEPNFTPPLSACPSPLGWCKFQANGFYHAVRRRGDEAWCDCCKAVDPFPLRCTPIPVALPPPPSPPTVWRPTYVLPFMDPM